VTGLEGITTGYETRFDFQQYTGMPPVRYLLASIPRAGSTWLSHQLWASGCLGAPLEYCNFEPGGHGHEAAQDLAAQVAVWRRSWRFRTSPNGVYGLKAFPAMLHELQHRNPPLLAEIMRIMAGPESQRKMVRLRRRNRDAHAISYARASLSGIWRKEQEGRPGSLLEEPEFSAVAVERCRKSLELQDAAWDQMCAELCITPLELWFEDVLADPEQAIGDVCTYLGVVCDPTAIVNVPLIEQQAQAGSRDWARKLAQD
jgi:trehalose 2-sulfotransferase